MNINELALRRLEGWEARQWIYLSLVGKIHALGDVDYLDRSDNYSALHGTSIMILAIASRASEVFEIAEKIRSAGALNLAVWILEWDKIQELVCSGYRFQTPKALPMSPEFKKIVTELSQELRNASD